MFKRALEMREEAFGAKHPDVGRSLNNLGEVLLELGELDGGLGAQMCFERCLEIQEATLPQNHPRIALTLKNIANLHLRRDSGDKDTGCTDHPAAALRFYERALSIEEESLESNHPQLVRTHSAIRAISSQSNTGGD